MEKKYKKYKNQSVADQIKAFVSYIGHITIAILGMLLISAILTVVVNYFRI